VDLAIVAVPNALHAPVSCCLLEAGIHVLCEKPLARTVDECQTMLDAAAAGGALLSAGHNRRFRANVRETKTLLDAGVIGEIYRVDAEEGGRSDWPRSNAYFDPAVAGGGALLDVGIHSIDLIRYLVDEFDDVRYAGNGTSTSVESEATLQFTMANGATGEIRCSRERDLRNQLTLAGTDGTLVMGLWGRSLKLSKSKGKAFEQFSELKISPSKRTIDGSFVEQLHSFVNAIQKGSEIKCSGLDGLRAVEVVEWAYRGVCPSPAASLTTSHA
jgi:predicted dehydrogenase